MQKTRLQNEEGTRNQNLHIAYNQYTFTQDNLIKKIFLSMK